MTPVIATEQLAVFDDVLAPDELAALRAHVAGLEFRDVDTDAADSPWLPSDGQPQTGPAVGAWRDPLRALDDSKLARFPTGGPLDAVIERALAAPGPIDDDWQLVTAIPWRYAAGSALAWHTDGAVYAGAFAFYLHREWDAAWGGELVVADPAARCTALPDDVAARRRAITARVAERGVATAIAPRPNRLVVLAGGHPHRIARVESAAGHHVRTSISGFYVRTRLLSPHGATP